MCSGTFYLSMYPFDDGSTKLCLTNDECVSKKGFVHYSFTYTIHECLTGRQCEEYEVYEDMFGEMHQSYYPYNTVGLCLDATPDNSVIKKSSGYECETGYLYISGSKSKCFSKEYCIKDGTIVYDENMACIKGHRCTQFGVYLYRGRNGDECVSVKECLKKGWYSYSNLGECLKREPSTDGNFIERADGVYSCIGYSVSKDTYLYLLLYLGDTVQCVSRAKCYIDMHNIYYHDSCDMCVSR